MQNPNNLAILTPDDVDLQIVSDLPKKMYEGLIVEYAIGIPFLGKQRWISEIKNIVEKTSFVDDQRVGPYAFWHHLHEIKATKKGVLFRDTVHYTLPYGPLGAIAHRLYVRGQLESIFDFREKAMKAHFSA